MQHARSLKEKAVYEGVLELVAQGHSLLRLTVQQIADAAGIGKGTVYEYFSSREEIIKKTLLYRMQQELEGLEQALAGAQSFEQQVNALLQEVAKAVTSKLSSLQLILSHLPQEELRTLLSKEACLCDMFNGRIRTLLAGLLRSGVEEGILSPCEESYGLLVVSGVLMSYINALRAFGDTVDPTRLQAAEYRFLCKALA